MAVYIQNLSKSYQGADVFCSVDLELEDGGIYCLQAPSGAGKTTLFRILMGLEQPDQGRIWGMPEGPVAAVFQEDRLCPQLSAGKNIQLVGPVCGEKELLEELRKLLPEESLEKPVSEFSGGMRRRVSLLRAMLSPGKILLLDEPFTGLDEEARAMAIRFVLEHRRGRTLLFTTHHWEEAEAMQAKMIYWREDVRSWFFTIDGYL